MPIIDIVVVGRPLIEVLAAGVVMARDIMIDGSELAARSVVGIIIVVMGCMADMVVIMLLMGMDCCIVILGIALLMDMGCCMVIMGIIILGAPPGGLAAALSRSPNMAHIARTVRTGT
jgi:hypothetical protein